MNTKNVIKNLAILLIISIGFFSIYSFTSIDADTNDLTSYDYSFYQDQNTNKVFSYLSPINNDNDKCGGDKKAKDANDSKESKCGDGSASDKSSATEGKCDGDKKEAKKTEEKKEMKCGDGKCGDDKKEEKTEDGSKKTEEGKDTKCGTGKCGK